MKHYEHSLNMIRRISSTSKLSHGIKLPLKRRPSIQNIDMQQHQQEQQQHKEDADSINNNSDKTNIHQRLIRQQTFIIGQTGKSDNGSTDESVSASFNSNCTSLEDIIHLLPSNLRPYISMHFQMIREENEDILQLLQEKENRIEYLMREHGKCEIKDKRLIQVEKELKNIKSQYERENAKNKSMIKKLKAMQSKCNNNLTTNNNGGDCELIWYGLDTGQPVGKMLENKKMTDSENYTKSVWTVNVANDSKKRRYEHKLVQTVEKAATTAPEKIRQVEKLMSKARSYRSQIQEMKNEMGSLKRVSIWMYINPGNLLVVY